MNTFHNYRIYEADRVQRSERSRFSSVKSERCYLYPRWRIPILVQNKATVYESHGQKGLIMVPAFPNIKRTRQLNLAALVNDRNVIFWRSGTRLEHVARLCSLWVGVIVISSLCIAINAAFSRFDRRQSSISQRLITMGWLLAGLLFGPAFGYYTRIQFGKGPDNISNAMINSLRYAFKVLVFGGALSVAGFVIVGLMLQEWGSCINVNSSIF